MLDLDGERRRSVWDYTVCEYSGTETAQVGKANSRRITSEAGGVVPVLPWALLPAMAQDARRHHSRLVPQFGDYWEEERLDPCNCRVEANFPLVVRPRIDLDQ